MDSTFRTAQTPVEVEPVKVADPTTAAKEKAPELLATYEDENKKPYVAKYLEIDGISDEPQFGRDLKEIEGFLRSRVTKGELDNSTQAADKYLKELERKAGLTRYESVNQRITKLLAYIDFMKVVES